MSGVRVRRAGKERRTRAVDAAIDVLAERGYEHTRFADVSAICEVAISTLQCYFGSREDMVIEALRRAIELDVLAIEEIAAAEPHPWRRIVALVSRSLDISERDRRIQLEFWRATIRDDELREFCDGMAPRCKEPYLRAVMDGAAQGMFHIEQDPQDIVDVMKAVLCGLSHPWAAQRARPLLAGFRDVWLGQLAATLGVSGEHRIGEHRTAEHRTAESAAR
jgi:AcrR family transcriptional regulator